MRLTGPSCRGWSGSPSHNAALLVAVMQAHGLTKLASNDTDLDRVPWLTRYAPA